ncbi:sensor histidine kinase [Gordonia humi]|uniref:Signal transduction histidine-protein kinase/phosphatase MprB n=1 Tax=Gordonia humi TaxID=686429 RepID=A0A840F891_9ACTN|nr:HAMP domain-containing sensor histidine kinase [Gordonia humi]MBB4135737.1 signal transduction histidine kinase [Gordonia humi]
MMIVTVALMGLLLGVPLTILTVRGMSAEARQNLSESLKRISEYVLAEETVGHDLEVADLDLKQFRLLVPAGGRLTLNATVTGANGVEIPIRRAVGDDQAESTISESVTLGPHATLTLEIPQENVRPQQLVAVGVLLVVLTGSVAGGALVAVVTARRLAEPLTALAARAGAMARGDLSSGWPSYGIDELDRVAEALADANQEIATRLEREGEIVGDVSHQLRSRLTAVHLRLDELTLHEDPAVVAEAEAGLEQVERLSRELDELVAASREDSAGRGAIDARDVVDTLIGDFEPAFRAKGRRLRAETLGRVPTISGKPGRLREALSVLIDNSLQHGAGTTTVRLADLPAVGMVRLTVADSGPGIADEIAVDVFRRGFSGGSRSGMGLSLSRALIEAEGGRLDLISRRPAVFAIVLPAQGRRPSGADHITRVRVPHR